MDQSLQTPQSKSVAVADSVEAELLNLPQAPCPVVHRFGPGIYVREVTLPAGTLAVGHKQRFPHLNIMLTGKVAMIDEGQVRVLEAPLMFTGQPGRKVGYVIEECVWQNIYATDETDVEELENHFLEKSITWQEHRKLVDHFHTNLHQEDRDDFELLLSEVGMTADQVRAQTENTDDQIPMPKPWSGVVSVRPSHIEGKGLFISTHAPEDTMIAPARLGGYRTPAGRYVNHAKSPNCKFVKTGTGDIFLVSLRTLHGCHGGDSGEELTVDYRQALSLSSVGDN